MLFIYLGIYLVLKRIIFIYPLLLINCIILTLRNVKHQFNTLKIYVKLILEYVD